MTGSRWAKSPQWLARDSADYDLAVACDTLIYFGDLEPVMKTVKMRLKPNGLFAFSVERGDHGLTASPIQVAMSIRKTTSPPPPAMQASACWV